MDFLELAKTRYTTKLYQEGTKISNEQIAQIKEIMRLCPSSINSQPWKFLFVSNPALKAELATVSRHNAVKINGASHVIVFKVIDNLDLLEKHLQENIAEYAFNYYKQYIKPLPEAEIKAWMQHQVYLSLGFLLSACASMGIDSTPMEGIELAEYDKLVPVEGYKTLFAVAMGYRSAEDANQPAKNPKRRAAMTDVVINLD